MQGLDENEHIFISYKSASDGGGTIGREFAEKLKDAFEEQLCIECFIDTASIHSGDNWLQKLRQAVGRAKAVICLVSDVYMNSDWCSYEFMIARQDQKAFPFSVQSDFNPANYADLHINQIPSILHWDGKITHPLLENEIPNIARKLERPIEGLLSAIRAEDPGSRTNRSTADSRSRRPNGKAWNVALERSARYGAGRQIRWVTKRVFKRPIRRKSQNGFMCETRSGPSQ